MPTKRINLLQITTHDSGRHFGCYGHSTLHTPAIDGLAADGMRMTNWFCPVPICSPSRTSMLTGLYPQEHGQLDLTGFGWKLKDPAWHMSSRLQAAGYHTALFGLQHEVLPDELDTLGFDAIVPLEPESNAEKIGKQVASFLSSDKATQKPFYLQVGFRETHTPFVANGAQPDDENGVEIPPYLADDEGNRQNMAAFQGAVGMADSGVERILEGLGKSGLEKNTLVVFTTDHGIEMPRAKWHLYDSGIETAMIMRCPALGLTGGRTFDGLASHVDYLPTIFELLELPAPDAAGQSVASYFTANKNTNSAPPRRDAIFAMFGKRSHPRCARTGRYKLIRHFDSAAVNFAPVQYGTEMAKKICKPIELYDLEKDPNEFENVADQEQYQQVRHDLDDKLWRWMESVDDPLLAGPVETPGYKKTINDYQQWKND